MIRAMSVASRFLSQRLIIPTPLFIRCAYILVAVIILSPMWVWWVRVVHTIRYLSAAQFIAVLIRDIVIEELSVMARTVLFTQSISLRWVSVSILSFSLINVINCFRGTNIGTTSWQILGLGCFKSPPHFIWGASISVIIIKHQIFLILNRGELILRVFRIILILKVVVVGISIVMIPRRRFIFNLSLIFSSRSF